MSSSTHAGKDASGTIAAFCAYGFWGLFPLYWKQLVSVDPVQILCHRFIWAAVFCTLLLAVAGRLRSMMDAMRDRRRARLLLSSSLLITLNWGLYIFAVNSGRITESSLGYYINPLVSVALGAIFLHERVDGWTKAAVAVAGAGIVGAAIVYGSVPWVSLVLGFTFAVYGLVKKRLGLSPVVSLGTETLIATPVAVLVLLFRHSGGGGAFLTAGPLVTGLLVGGGIVTAIPLLLFAKAANSISLQKMGFIQYLSPTLQLIIGILVYGERPAMALVVTFCGVAIAVMLYVFTRRGAV